MLVLSRKVGQSVQIGHNITVEVQKLAGNRVSLAFTAPDGVRILRSELDPFTDEPCYDASENQDDHEDPPLPMLVDRRLALR